jgi:hypothetical protein
VIAAGNNTGTYSVDMSSFVGEEMAGTWRMWIEDTYGDGGHQATNIEVTFTYVVSEIDWLMAAPTSGIVAPGDCVVITVSADASELEPGLHEGYLLVSSNDPVHPEIEVPVYFEVTEAGYLTMEPDTMWVDVLEDMYQMATIINNSNADVEVLEIQETGINMVGWNTEQLSQTLPHTLQPGDEMTFWVHIWPGVSDNSGSYIWDSVQIVTDIDNYYMTLAVNPDLISSINDPEQPKANIYPSPFTEMLTIDLKDFNETIVLISILDLNGRAIKRFDSESIQNNSLTWIANDAGQKIEPGIYFIQIFAGDKTEVVKVIKTK